jgi:hypothetical protein
MEKTEIQALEMVRRIRDEQAAFLAGKDEEEVLEFFRKAGEVAREDARKRSAESACTQQDVQEPGHP